MWIHQWAATVLLIENWLPASSRERVGIEGEELGLSGTGKYVLRAYNPDDENIEEVCVEGIFE